MGRAKLPTLQNRRLQASVAILMFKVKRGLCPDYMMRLFSYHNTDYNLRTKEFVIPRVDFIPQVLGKTQ